MVDSAVRVRDDEVKDVIKPCRSGYILRHEVLLEEVEQVPGRGVGIPREGRGDGGGIP